MSDQKPPKQVIVVRADLKMQRGKEVAQGAHASMAFIANRLRVPLGGEDCEDFDDGTIYEFPLRAVEREWLYNGRFTKICLSVDSEQALVDLYDRAKAAGLEVNMITDSGLTVFHGVPTKTCLAIGPDWPDRIDPLTQGLKLR